MSRNTRLDIEHKRVISQDIGSRQSNPNSMKAPDSKTSFLGIGPNHTLPPFVAVNTDFPAKLHSLIVRRKAQEQQHQIVPDRKKQRDQRESTEIKNSISNISVTPSPPIQKQPQLLQRFSNIRQNDMNASLGPNSRFGFRKGRQQQHGPKGDNPKDSTEFAGVTNYSCEDLMSQVKHHTDAIRQDYLNMRRKIVEQEMQLQQLKKIPVDLQKRQEKHFGCFPSMSTQQTIRRLQDIGMQQGEKYQVTNQSKSSHDSSTAKKEPRYPDEMLMDGKLLTSVQKHISAQQELKMTQEKLVRIEIQAKKVLEEFTSTVQELKDEIQSFQKNEKQQNGLINQLYRIIESKNKELRNYELQKTTSVRAKSANPNEDHMAKSDLLNLFRRIKDKNHIES